jgi:hypothetical protein
MLRFQELPENDQQEAIRIADEMRMREEGESRQRDATVQAAEELGISQKYLDRAAEELQARRIEAVLGRRRRVQIAAASVAAVGAIGLGTALLRPAPPAPPTVVAVEQTTVSEQLSPGTSGAVTVENGTATLRVDRFGGERGYFANAQLPVPADLGRFKKVTFTARAEGALRNVRFDIENGNQRWKGPNVSLSPEDKTFTVDFGRLQAQARRGGQWRNVSAGRPTAATNITFKVGETINPATASGTVVVGAPTFE